MKSDLADNGWALGEHHLPKEIVNLLVRKKNEFLETSIREVGAAFGVSIEVFDAENTEVIELAKGITRSLLRYDACSFLLARAVYTELNKKYGIENEVKYVAIPYPIIHYALDTSEIGEMHRDGYDYVEHFYTTWTPLNDCFHKPIAVIEKSHLKNGFILRQLRARIKRFDKFILSRKKKIYPDIPLGQFAIWYGSTFHEGLLNKSEIIATALVVRFTNTPILFDLAFPIKDLMEATIIPTEVNCLEFTKKMIQCFKEIEIISKNSLSEKDSFETILLTIQQKIESWKFSAEDAQRFAFMIGLWAQRMESKRNVLLFYLFSFLSAHNNFYVLHKCITMGIRNYSIHSMEAFINSIIKKYPCIQMNHVVQNAISLAGEKANGMNIKFEPQIEYMKFSLGK